jgi:hypothetical protein
MSMSIAIGQHIGEGRRTTALAPSRRSRRFATSRVSAVPPYERWTKDALYHEAKRVGIEGRLHMNKADLIETLRRV